MLQIQPKHVSQYKKNHHLLLTVFQKKIPSTIDNQILGKNFECQIDLSIQLENLALVLLDENAQNEIDDDYMRIIYLLLVHLAVHEVENNTSHFSFV